MKVFHHNDSDGLCAAALVGNSLAVVFDKPEKEDFVEYNYDGDIDIPDEYIKDGETVYIVDLSLSDSIYNLIKKCIDKGCKVIHIDHHQSTFKYLQSIRSTDVPKYTHFYKEGISGAMLTYIYSCMSEEERIDPENVAFDFSDKRTHVAFNYNTPDMREYRIPTIIRFIDDNDVWLHEIDETKYFCIAFQMEQDIAPYEEIWDKLIYGSEQRVYGYVNDGKLIYKYQESVDKKNMSSSFEYDILGNQCLCLNTCCCYGNSRIFGEKFEEYPMVCKFGYDGSIRKWRYTLYSSENREDSVDVETIAKKFGGGGHAHAAGFVLTYNLFETPSSLN